jgi:hypothetical protein
MYDLSIEVKVVATNNNGENGYDGVDVGLDKHIIEHESNEEKAESSIDNGKNHGKISKNNIKIAPSDEDKSTGLAINPPQPTQPTQNTSITVLTTKEQQSSRTIAEDIDMADKIYRLGSTDLWACKYCKLREDKWFMKKHLCKGSK